MAKKCGKCYALTQRLNRREKLLADQKGQLQSISQTILLAKAEAEQTGRSDIIGLCGEISAVLNNQPAPVQFELRQNRKWQDGAIMSKVNRVVRWLGFGQTQPVLHRDGPPAMTVVPVNGQKLPPQSGVLGVPENVLLPQNGVPGAKNGVLGGGRGVLEGAQSPPESYLRERTLASTHAFSMKTAEFERKCAYALKRFMESSDIDGRVAGAIRAPQALVLKIDLDNVKDRSKLAATELALWVGVGDDQIEVKNRNGQLCCIINLPETLRQSVYSEDLSGGAIGLDLDGQSVTLPFSQTNNSLFIVGIQGTGKTELLQTILHALARSHGVGELELLVIDHRDSLVGFDNLAHLARPRITDPSAVNGALQSVVSSAPKRGDKAIPLYVLIDEIGELVTQYGLEPSMLGKVANQRRYNVHIIAATQQVNKDTTGDFANWSTMRIFGNLADAAQSGRVAGAGVNAHLLQPPGDFVLIRSGRAQRFQAALTTPDQIACLPKLRSEPALLQAPPKSKPEPEPEQARISEPATIDIDIDAELELTGRNAPDFYLPVLLAAELAHLNGETGQKSIALAAKHYKIGKDKVRAHREFAERIREVYLKLIEEERHAAV